MTSMFRSIQQILDHADELADRCEAYEPAPDDERPVAEYLLKRAAAQKARCEHQIAQAVAAARADGSSWPDIHRILGTSEETASQNDGPVEEGLEVTPSEVARNASRLGCSSSSAHWIPVQICPCIGMKSMHAERRLCTWSRTGRSRLERCQAMCTPQSSYSMLTAMDANTFGSGQLLSRRSTPKTPTVPSKIVLNNAEESGGEILCDQTLQPHLSGTRSRESSQNWSTI